jgi:hypothetical protein
MRKNIQFHGKVTDVMVEWLTGEVVIEQVQALGEIRVEQWGSDRLSEEKLFCSHLEGGRLSIVDGRQGSSFMTLVGENMQRTTLAVYLPADGLTTLSVQSVGGTVVVKLLSGASDMDVETVASAGNKAAGMSTGARDKISGTVAGTCGKSVGTVAGAGNMGAYTGTGAVTNETERIARAVPSVGMFRGHITSGQMRVFGGAEVAMELRAIGSTLTCEDVEAERLAMVCLSTKAAMSGAFTDVRMEVTGRSVALHSSITPRMVHAISTGARVEVMVPDHEQVQLVAKKLAGSIHSDFPIAGNESAGASTTVSNGVRRYYAEVRGGSFKLSKA